MDRLRIRMKGRETVFELTVEKRDVKAKCAEHMMLFGREMIGTGRHDHRGKEIFQTREVPRDVWVFEWVTNLGEPSEKVEPITLE